MPPHEPKWERTRQWVTFWASLLTLLAIPPGMWVAKLYVHSHDVDFSESLASNFVSRVEFDQRSRWLSISDEKQERDITALTSRVLEINNKVDTVIVNQTTNSMMMSVRLDELTEQVRRWARKP